MNRPDADLGRATISLHPDGKITLTVGAGDNAEGRIFKWLMGQIRTARERTAEQAADPMPPVPTTMSTQTDWAAWLDWRKRQRELHEGAVEYSQPEPPAGAIHVPDWTPEQIASFQEHWETMSNVNRDRFVGYIPVRDADPLVVFDGPGLFKDDGTINVTTEGRLQPGMTIAEAAEKIGPLIITVDRPGRVDVSADGKLIAFTPDAQGWMP